MKAFFVGLTAVLAAIAVIVAVMLYADPEAHPPHVARPTAGVAIGTLPLAISGADQPGEVIVQVTAWVEGTLEHERQVAAALADLARSNPVRSSSGSTQPGATSFGGDCAALSAELGLPEAILWRESRCSWDAYNATGCGGRGCLGPAQVDAGHFAPVSPWNPSTHGACYGLEYAECVARLSGGGTNLAPWR